MTLLLTFFLVLTVINVPTQADDDLKPDLVIFSMDCPDTINEEKQLNITIRIKNQGTKNISIGTIIEVGLYVDNILVKTKSTTNGLDINETTYMNLTWIAELGPKTKRLISVIVDHNNLIIESNENNNVWSGD